MMPQYQLRREDGLGLKDLAAHSGEAASAPFHNNSVPIPTLDHTYDLKRSEFSSDELRLLS